MENEFELDNKAIGQRIREERIKFGLSQEKFAEIVGLSHYYIGQLERGERQMSLPTLVEIANCLHISLDYLVFGKNIYVKENDEIYNSNINIDIVELMNKCSNNELELFKEIMKTVLPYIKLK